jgi:glycosyltransferase involved in cell wall biosynthesis
MCFLIGGVLVLNFTVAIPTYNGATRIPQVLQKLRSQTGTENIAWEVLVVDNNSNDLTFEVVKEFQNNWLANIPLRYCQESQQGLAFARQKAIQESQGKYVGFLDDDNLPATDWVAAAFYFGENYPQCGAYGSRIQGLFEKPPPENFEKLKRFLAVEDRGDRAHLFDPDNLRLPPGAGLVVRKQAWQECVPASISLVGRVGGSMLPGEEYEVLLYMHKGGWEIWYNPEMVTQHKMSASRLDKEYLLLIAYNGGLVTSRLRAIATKKAWHKPFIFTKGFLGSFRRWIFYSWQNQKKLGKDLATDVEEKFLWGTFVSYLYYLKGKI